MGNSGRKRRSSSVIAKIVSITEARSHGALGCHPERASSASRGVLLLAELLDQAIEKINSVSPCLRGESLFFGPRNTPPSAPPHKVRRSRLRSLTATPTRLRPSPQ